MRSAECLLARSCVCVFCEVGIGAHIFVDRVGHSPANVAPPPSPASCAGFLESAVAFVLREAPSTPPQVSSVPAGSTAASAVAAVGWAAFFGRPGLPAALKMLSGLSRGHAGAQTLLAERGLLERLHWMEGTSTSGEVKKSRLLLLLVGGIVFWLGRQAGGEGGCRGNKGCALLARTG